MIPFPDPTAVALMLQLVGDEVADRVGTDEEIGSVPFVRLTLVADLEPPTNWERTPLFQVEVWHHTPYEAGVLATRIANLWPTVRRSTAAGAYVSGAWVESMPRPLPDPNTDHARYFLEVGLRIHTPKE